MRSPLSVLASFLAVCLVATGAYAAGDGNGPWVVATVSGDVQVKSADGGWRSIAAGETVAPGTVLKSGADGRIEVTRDGDSVSMSPQSSLELPAGPAGGSARGVVQKAGTLLYKIFTRPENPFDVKTPYLAAVIKGTVFTVTVNQEGTALHVTKGAVEVRSMLSGDVALIRPGQTGMGYSAPGKGLKVLGGATIRKSEAPASDAKPSEEQKSEAGSNEAAKPNAASATANAATPGKAATRALAVRQAIGVSADSGQKSAIAGDRKVSGTPFIAKRVGNPHVNLGAATNGLIQGPAGTPAGIRAANGKNAGTSLNSVAVTESTGSSVRNGVSAVSNGVGASVSSVSNAGGNGNGVGSVASNAGGNGNGVGSVVSNAGGNGNGVGSVVSNAGGNGNGVGSVVSNAGGNGNGNAGGNGNGNAGGNGNGNGKN